MTGAGRLDLILLARWINGCLMCEGPIPRRSLANADLGVLDLAERCGIFRGAALANRMTCHYCEDPHACTVACGPDGVYHYRCLANGRVNVDEHDLALLAFDRAALLAALVAAISGPVSGIRLFAKERLARLGFVASHPNRQAWVLGYADGLDDEAALTRVIDALAAEMANGPGLVVTPSPVPMSLPLPRGYRLIALRELFFGRKDGFHIDHEAAEVRLGRPKSAPGSPGRPSQREVVRKIWLAARQSENWPAQRTAQAEMILSHWPPQHGARPAAKTIKHHIGSFERASDPSNCSD
jgi:hypothetical protein